MTDDLVGRLRERMAAATTLPWEMNPPGAWWEQGMTYTVPKIAMDDARYYPSAPNKDDAELIVEAVNALPTLLARIEALEGALRQIAEMHRGKPAHDIARAALAKDKSDG